MEQGHLAHNLAAPHPANRPIFSLDRYQRLTGENQNRQPIGYALADQVHSVVELGSPRHPGEFPRLFFVQALEESRPRNRCRDLRDHRLLPEQVDDEAGYGLRCLVQDNTVQLDGLKQPDHPHPVDSFHAVKTHRRQVGGGEEPQLEQGPLHGGSMGADIHLDILHARIAFELRDDLLEQAPNRTRIDRDQLENPG